MKRKTCQESAKETGKYGNLTIVAYGNSSEEFDIGHCPIKVKVTA